MRTYTRTLSSALLAAATWFADLRVFADDNRAPSQAEHSDASSCRKACPAVPSVSFHLVTSTSLPISEGTQSHLVLCPAGEAAVGGGVVPVSADGVTPQVDTTLVASYPVTAPVPPVGAPPPASGTADGWAGIIRIGADGVSTFLRVYAVCAAPALAP